MAEKPKGEIFKNKRRIWSQKGLHSIILFMFVLAKHDKMEYLNRNLRFGIITDDIKMQQWQANVVKTLVANGLSLSLIIKMQGNEGKSIGKKASFWYRKVSNRLISSTESQKTMKLNDYVDISGIPIKNCIAKVIDNTLYFSENDVQFIENQDIDFIIRLCDQPIGGELVNCIRHGIWEFCFHDESAYHDAQPIGFWEFIGKGYCNVVSLQRISSNRSKALILRKNRYPILKKSYSDHVEQILTECSQMPLQVCRDIMANGKADDYETSVGKDAKQGLTLGGLLKYLHIRLWRKILGTGKDINNFDRDIGIAEVPVFDFCNNPDKYRKKVKWLRRKSTGERYSTPLAITTANDTYVFFTVADDKQKSRINMVKKSEDYKKQHTVLDNGHALSYPFVFRKDEGVFCIPQDIESQQITLYRFDEGSMTMQKDTILYDGIKAYRPTVVSSNGLWNLFFGKEGSSDTKLNLLISDDLRGTYTPFFNNPVKTDCRGALMAGGFIAVNGKLYRPAFNESQRCVAIYEVKEISRGSYKEAENETLTIGSLKRSKFGRGVQCISGNDLITVVDGMR